MAPAASQASEGNGDFPVAEAGSRVKASKGPSRSRAAAHVLLELWEAFLDGRDVGALFARDAVVELPFPLLKGTSKHVVGRSSIVQLSRALNALEPNQRPRGDLRAVAKTSNEIVAEYRRHPTESSRAGHRRIFVWVIEQKGLISRLRVVLERHRSNLPK